MEVIVSCCLCWTVHIVTLWINTPCIWATLSVILLRQNLNHVVMMARIASQSSVHSSVVRLVHIVSRLMVKNRFFIVFENDSHTSLTF